MDGLIGDYFIGFAVDEKDRRLYLDFRGKAGCSREMPRKSNDGGRGFLAALKPATMGLEAIAHRAAIPPRYAFWSASSIKL
jgi:hypothetical protein